MLSVILIIVIAMQNGMHFEKNEYQKIRYASKKEKSIDLIREFSVAIWIMLLPVPKVTTHFIKSIFTFPT